MSFLDFKLHPTIVKNAAALGYETPTPIQAEAIPVVLKGRDLLGIAKTGTGKTISFVLPILHKLLLRPPEALSRKPKVLVIVPTRELANQILEVFEEIALRLPIKPKVMAVYGGVSINPQMKNMYGTEILIATPGRLLELDRAKSVDLSQVKVLVLDEADKILNLGFQRDMEEIFDLLPAKKQNLLFSATLSEKLTSLNEMILTRPAIINTVNEEDDIELINLSGYFVSDDRKGPLLRHLIKTKDMKQVLIFTSSRMKADRVATKLMRNGIEAVSIHGKKSQVTRMETLKKFKSGKLQVMVATDLISRGIDISELPYVINYELPRSPKDFVHRVGRTGRANVEGQAITFVTREETHHFKVILKKMKRYVDMIDSDEMDF